MNWNENEKKVLANQGTSKGFKAEARYRDINDHNCMC